MAKIREGVGEVHVHTEDGGTVVLREGDTVPSGVKVGSHVTDEGKAGDTDQLRAQNASSPVAGPHQTPQTAAQAEAAQKAADKAARSRAAAAKAQAEADEKARKAAEEEAKAQADAEAKAAQGGQS